MSWGELGVRGLAGQLRQVASSGDLDGLAVLLAQLIGERAPRRHLFQPVLLELIATIVRELQHRVGRRDGALYTVEVFDDDDCLLEIDAVPPALRAMLRAVLAALNDDGAGTRFQVGLVTGDPDPLGRLDAVVHVLRWANALTGGK
ncbi:hypothetical protein ABZ863_28620 [Saccharomonospora sp. NPDC046836]|uniref:hypothetical protein n=1 Tax=Saccharomonospora sp. NPDC046836 TaxID=3156921 RepID=UPI003408EE49